MSYRSRILILASLTGLSILLVLLPNARSQDKIMGQIQFTHVPKAVKTSGVWIDGLYVGYLSELGGSKRIRLLPGDHEIVVRQAGYGDFSSRATIEPGKILDIPVEMQRDERFQLPEPKTRAEIKLSVHPDRAGVFLDDNYVGHVDEFGGIGRGMLVSPGKHRIKIALSGYKAFETEINLLPRQKFALKTQLVEGSINDADPLIRTERTPELHARSAEAEATEQRK
jgi:hypothetical protein